MEKENKYQVIQYGNVKIKIKPTSDISYCSDDLLYLISGMKEKEEEISESVKFKRLNTIDGTGQI